MWIFTRDGFFSVTTDKRTDGENVMVRARVREDLERLRAFLDQPFVTGPVPEIVESKRADYRYRLIIPRLWWVGYVAQAAEDIDYTNVKDTIAPMATEPERHRAMLKVWSAMYALQPGGRGGWDLAEWDRLPDGPDDEDWDDESLWEEEL